jgi:hypothetical protein
MENEGGGPESRIYFVYAVLCSVDGVSYSEMY